MKEKLLALKAWYRAHVHQIRSILAALFSIVVQSLAVGADAVALWSTRQWVLHIGIAVLTGIPFLLKAGGFDSEAAAKP